MRSWGRGRCVRRHRLDAVFLTRLGRGDGGGNMRRGQARHFLPAGGLIAGNTEVREGKRCRIVRHLFFASSRLRGGESDVDRSMNYRLASHGRYVFDGHLMGT